jgi:DNA-binding response OmpR family regulator
MPPPRVLIVMPEQWPRALLRSALRERGYDAVGTRTLSTALRLPVTTSDRGPVRLIVLDHAALDGEPGDHLARLVASHDHPPTMLLARATSATPDGRWDIVLRRPVSVDDISRAVQTQLPLPREQRRAID